MNKLASIIKIIGEQKMTGINQTGAKDLRHRVYNILAMQLAVYFASLEVFHKILNSVIVFFIAFVGVYMWIIE